MKIGLFIPCFMNELYPKASMSTYLLLKKLKFEVEYPSNQTCCGQPMANSGCSSSIKNLAHMFVANFKDYDYVVSPSASCVTMVKEHYAEFFEDNKDYNKIKNSIYEITEFLHDVVKIDKIESSFPYKVGLHNSCHGHRSLGLGTPSELNVPKTSKLHNILSLVKDIEIVSLNRDDECCGFGGTFCVSEDALSTAMGRDRIKDHQDNKVEVMTGADMSCLMHMQGLISREKNPLKVLHISQILLGGETIMAKHPINAAAYVKNDERMHWHDKALWFVREKRDKASKSIPEWEELRSYADLIKSHTMNKLDSYLEEFEKNAINNGIKVHWAKDAQEHNEIVYKILKEKEVKKLVKSKSMLTEECHLNPYLEERGIEVIDTDLGERIVQLRNEAPSHIVLPAIHLKRSDVAETFHEKLGTQKGNDDPTYLTRSARSALREDFLSADAGLTGVNFAIAQTGGIVVCTNEGNADMGVSLPKLHIASMGMEKIIPRLKDLSVFTRLLARSAIGQPITSYTSHFHGPIDGGEMHIVIVDNKRAEFLASKDYVKALNCIRCGACMNTCPIYRRSGGHSYEYVIPGPIGSSLAAFKEPKKHNSLPFACTLCGSCTNVCPVKIDLDSQLYKHRQDLGKNGHLDKKKMFSMKVMTYVFERPKLIDFLGKVGRKIMPYIPKKLIYNKFNIWGKTRDIPELPEYSFKELYKKMKEDENDK